MDSPAPTPATQTEIAVAVGVLLRNMPAPRGTKTRDRLEGYLRALAGYPLEAIESAIAKFLRGEVPHLSAKFCPHPPELAGLVREISGLSAAGGAAKPGQKKLFAYRVPNSKVLERGCTKEFARQLVDSGVHPRGSIWCPGQIGDRPDIGDLFGPDPDWQRAVPWPPPSGGSAPVEAELTTHTGPMFGSHLRRMRDWTERKPPEPQGPPAPRKVPDYSQDKIEISEALKQSLDMRKATKTDRASDNYEGGT